MKLSFLTPLMLLLAGTMAFAVDPVTLQNHSDTNWRVFVLQTEEAYILTHEGLVENVDQGGTIDRVLAPGDTLIIEVAAPVVFLHQRFRLIDAHNEDLGGAGGAFTYTIWDPHEPGQAAEPNVTISSALRGHVGVMVDAADGLRTEIVADQVPAPALAQNVADPWAEVPVLPVEGLGQIIIGGSDLGLSQTEPFQL